MKSTYFIRFLEMVSGIQSLFADWTNEGNGMSQARRRRGILFLFRFSRRRSEALQAGWCHVDFL